MKLLFIHNTIPEYRIEFMNNLSNLIDTEFFISDKSLQEKIYGMTLESEIKNLKIDYISSTKRAKNIKNKIINSKCDVIILPPVDNIKEYINGVWALIYGKKNNKKVIYWTEKWEADLDKQPSMKKIKNFIQRIMIASLAKKCNICIAAGSKSKDYLRKIGIKEQKIKIAYDSSTSKKKYKEFDLRKKYNIPSEAKIILYLGRIVARKGADILIKAFNNIYGDIDNVYLLVCGDGDYIDECKKIASKLENNKIIFTGQIDYKLRSEYYSQSNIFVLPSYSLNGVIEAWGLTVNEAMECGLPVIATSAVGSAHDLIQNGFNGYVIKENDIDDLEDKILKIIKSDNYEVIKEQCVKTSVKYSVDNMAQSFFEAINLNE